MKRLRTILVGLVISLAPAVAVAAGVPAGASAAPGAGAAAARLPRAQLIGALCQTALDPPARAVAVTAVMRPLPGTLKLQLEFQLLERATGASAWVPVSAPGLGTWVSPTSPATLGQRPTDVWEVKKPVADLAAPASYRFQVAFRWLGATGAVVGTSTQTSRICREPELRPDLTLEAIHLSAAPGKPNVEQYQAVIGNIGATGAGPFTVQLSAGGQALATRTVPHIAPHQTLTVTLTGPACDPAAPPTITVDPGAQIDVYSRAQATLAAQCQAPVGAANGIPVSG
jgi:hypothetical protein